MLKDCVDIYIKQQDYNRSCIQGIDFWLTVFLWHDEAYCKSIMNAAYSDYIAVNPYC